MNRSCIVDISNGKISTIFNVTAESINTKLIEHKYQTDRTISVCICI